VVAHDLECPLARASTERVGAVGEGIEMERSSHNGADQEREGGGDGRGQGSSELTGRKTDERADAGSDQRIDGRAAGDVATIDGQQAADGNARQECDRRESGA
jgi:hypothetical protein